MSRGVVLMGVVLVVFLAAYASIMLLEQTSRAASTQRWDVEPGAPPPAPVPGTDAERLVLTVELPALGEPLTPPVGGPAPESPIGQVSMLLAVRIANPHGVVVVEAVPGGPAAEAGITAGDSIVECDGMPVTCPSALLPFLARGAERRQVDLTVLRGK